MNQEHAAISATKIAQLTDRLEQSTDPAERLTLLLTLATMYRMSDSERSVAYARTAFEEARDAGNWTWAAASLCDMALAYTSTANYRAALRTLNQAKKLIDERDVIPQVRSLLYGNFAEISVLKADYPAAMRWFRMGLEVTLQPDMARQRAYSLLNMGRMFVRLRDYPTALRYMGEALGMAEKMGEPELLGKVLTAIATVHQELHDYEAARQCYERSYQLFLQCGFQVETARAQVSIATICVKLNQLDDAFPRIEEGLATFRHSGITNYITIALRALAEAHSQRGEHQRVLQLLEEALALDLAISNRQAEASTLQFMAETYLAMENIERAAGYVERSLLIAEELQDSALMFNCYEILSTIHERLGDPARSLTYLKLCIATKEKVENMKAQRALVMLEMQGEMDKVHAELELYRERQAAIEREAEQSRHELAALTLQLAQKSERAEKLEGKIRSHAGRARGETAVVLKSLLAELGESRNDDNQWIAFERQFNHLYPEFLQKLSGSYSSLTPTELKVCSLVRINLATKEIASILCTSVRTIDNHRRHIRVKMGLPAGANLTTLLTAL